MTYTTNIYRGSIFRIQFQDEDAEEHSNKIKDWMECRILDSSGYEKDYRNNTLIQTFYDEYRVMWSVITRKKQCPTHASTTNH